jgi:hypothetical protein
VLGATLVLLVSSVVLLGAANAPVAAVLEISRADVSAVLVGASLVSVGVCVGVGVCDGVSTGVGVCDGSTVEVGVTVLPGTSLGVISTGAAVTTALLCPTKLTVAPGTVTWLCGPALTVVGGNVTLTAGSAAQKSKNCANCGSTYVFTLSGAPLAAAQARQLLCAFMNAEGGGLVQSADDLPTLCAMSRQLLQIA